MFVTFRIKQSILRRGDVVASRWRRAALKVKLQNATAARSGSKTSVTERPKSKVTIRDIARLAVAERDSNLPSDEEDDIEEKTSL